MASSSRVSRSSIQRRESAIAEDLGNRLIASAEAAAAAAVRKDDEAGCIWRIRAGLLRCASGPPGCERLWVGFSPGPRQIVEQGSANRFHVVRRNAPRSLLVAVPDGSGLRTSSSVVCEKSTYQSPTAEKGSAAGRRPAQAGRRAPGAPRSAAARWPRTYWRWPTSCAPG